MDRAFKNKRMERLLQRADKDPRFLFFLPFCLLALLPSCQKEGGVPGHPGILLSAERAPGWVGLRIPGRWDARIGAFVLVFAVFSRPGRDFPAFDLIRTGPDPGAATQGGSGIERHVIAAALPLRKRQFARRPPKPVGSGNYFSQRLPVSGSGAGRGFPVPRALARSRRFPAWYTVIKNRYFAGDTTFVFEGKTYPAVKFELKEHIELDQIGVFESTYPGMEIYAKELGLVYFRKEIQENMMLAYRLKSRFSMEKLEERFRSRYSTGAEPAEKKR